MLTLNSLASLQTEYLECKKLSNLVVRYSRLRDIIKGLGVKEKGWIPLEHIPPQARSYGMTTLQSIKINKIGTYFFLKNP